MKASTLILTCLFGILYVSALPLNSLTPTNQHSAENSIIDALVTELNRQVHLDPLTLPKHVTNVSRYFGLLKLEGQVVLHYIKITGLSGVRRVGEVEVFEDPNSKSTKIYKVKLEIGGEQVQATSSVSAYFGPYIHPELRTKAEIGAVGSSLSVAVDYSESGQNNQITPILKDFDIDRLEKVHLHVQGPFLPFDPIIELISDAFANIFNIQARHLLSAHVRPLVEEHLRGVHLNLTDTTSTTLIPSDVLAH